MSDSLFSTHKQVSDSTQKCLDKTFRNDAERLENYRGALRKALSSPEYRHRNDFPVADDSTLIELSNPPYFTPCPNPFLETVIQCHTRTSRTSDQYERDPFATDVSEGRGDALYNAHGYHTKVPHKAIMRYILHYTEPDDIVFDGFCGTGMTGLAALMCADRQTIESLGYTVGHNGDIRDSDGAVVSRIGSRTAIISDLSPVAGFIASNYCFPQNPELVAETCGKVLSSAESELGWMLSTLHGASPSLVAKTVAALNSPDYQSAVRGLAHGRIHYVIWSDVFSCAQCGRNIIYWSEAVDVANGKIRDTFPCPSCRAQLTKRNLDRVWESSFDPWLRKISKVVKSVPVSINYTVAGKTHEKAPDKYDLAVIEKIKSLKATFPFPTSPILKGDKTGDPFGVGIHYVHQYFTGRNLWLISYLWANASSPAVKWAITGIMQRASKQHQIAITRIGGEKAGEGGATAGHRRGTLYIPSNQVEFNPFDLFDERVKTITQALQKTSAMERQVFISVNSATSVGVPDDSIDYIFVDPPFGANIMYSELNYAWECLLGVVTNPRTEAVQNRTQQKGLNEYQDIMTSCFREFFRILKPGRWITVEFHNSKNSVWNAIQEAIQRAGFVVADVRLLDKQLKTHTQRTAAGAVNKDLVISAYRPQKEFEKRFLLSAGTEEAVWEFVRQHLKRLPVFVKEAGQAHLISERQKYLLYDRMLAFHVERGVAIPINAAEFYLGLQQRFSERDEMYFLSEQVPEYDKKRLLVKEFLQMEFFVSDEVSAIQWLRQQLLAKPQTFQELQPQFLQEMAGWLTHEKPLELSLLLEENFLVFTGEGEVPSQIHSYLSTNFKELRGLGKVDGALIRKAKDRWYVADARKEADLEQVRSRGLLREFRTYVDVKGKLKNVRSEALRAGFKECWQRNDYAAILQMSKRVPESVIQEDPALLMYYDNALMRTGE